MRAKEALLIAVFLSAFFLLPFGAAAEIKKEDIPVYIK